MTETNNCQNIEEIMSDLSITDEEKTTMLELVNKINVYNYFFACTEAPKLISKQMANEWARYFNSLIVNIAFNDEFIKMQTESVGGNNPWWWNFIYYKGSETKVSDIAYIKDILTTAASKMNNKRDETSFNNWYKDATEDQISAIAGMFASGKWIVFKELYYKSKDSNIEFDPYTATFMNLDTKEQFENVEFEDNLMIPFYWFCYYFSEYNTNSNYRFWNYSPKEKLNSKQHNTFKHGKVDIIDLVLKDGRLYQSQYPKLNNGSIKMSFKLMWEAQLFYKLPIDETTIVAKGYELEKDKMPNYAWKVDSYKDYTIFYNSIKNKMDEMAKKVAGTCLKGNICSMDITIPQVYVTGNLNMNLDQEINCNDKESFEPTKPGEDPGMAKIIAMIENYKENKDIFDNIEEKTKSIQNQNVQNQNEETPNDKEQNDNKKTNGGKLGIIIIVIITIAGLIFLFLIIGVPIIVIHKLRKAGKWVKNKIDDSIDAKNKLAKAQAKKLEAETKHLTKNNQ